jgi:hypothetical protein
VHECTERGDGLDRLAEAHVVRKEQSILVDKCLHAFTLVWIKAARPLEVHSQRLEQQFERRLKSKEQALSQ